eukprot:TRINITY_DN6053_c0_g1_i1.p1 TRINITY_DN6053_c0_g1~~TRINITY_DN6053_c0_g1_i1.p1  ORF type:complete len:252 (+),score=17.67 TRINITY_DN6053_c0_g1_i1:20-775(+)
MSILRFAWGDLVPSLDSALALCRVRLAQHARLFPNSRYQIYTKPEYVNLLAQTVYNCPHYHSSLGIEIVNDQLMDRRVPFVTKNDRTLYILIDADDALPPDYATCLEKNFRWHNKSTYALLTLNVGMNLYIAEKLAFNSTQSHTSIGQALYNPPGLPNVVHPFTTDHNQIRHVFKLEGLPHRVITATCAGRYIYTRRVCSHSSIKKYEPRGNPVDLAQIDKSYGTDYATMQKIGNALSDPCAAVKMGQIIV